MKKIIYVIIFIAGGMVLNSCYAGYVASEPAYVEYSRPAQPSSQHFWIDGDWGWNFQRHVYVQKTGYWEKPRPGQLYVKGNWNDTKSGKTWSKGHWQKQGRR